MDWYRATAKDQLQNFFEINFGESVYFRINEDSSTITVKYTFYQHTFSREEYLNFIEPRRDEEERFITCKEELSKSLEDNYQRLVFEANKLLKKAKKEKEEQVLLATLNEDQKVDYELKKQVEEIALDKTLKTKKDKIVEIVKKLGIKKKSELQKYYPTDNSYLNEVFEKYVYGTLISFEEKRQLEIC